MAIEFARSQSIRLSCVGAMPGRYQNHTPKPTNIAELKSALLSIWNDLPQEFIDKQSCHFERDFDRVLLQLVDILNTQLNTERAADTYH